MYHIYFNDDKSKEITKIYSPVLSQAVNTAGTLEFTSYHHRIIAYDFEQRVEVGDPYFGQYKERITKVSVYKDNNLKWKGMLFSSTLDSLNARSLTFVGEMTYLNDVLYPPYNHKGSPRAFMQSVLDYYNSKCSADKKILLGNVTVVDNNDYIVRSSEDWATCWDVLSDKLIESSLGGYFKLRYSGNTRYLDYLAESGSHNSQKIEFGKNLKDIEQYIDATELATVIIPIGAEIEKEEGDESETIEYVTIESVNGGRNYIESPLVSTYGRIEKKVRWEDVTVPANLLAKAREYLDYLTQSAVTITADVFDLSTIDNSIEELEIGDTADCYSPPHDLNVRLMISSRTTNLAHHAYAKDVVTLGLPKKTFTSHVKASAKKQKEVTQEMINNIEIDTEELEGSLIEKMTEMLNQGKDGFVTLVKDNDGRIRYILVTDSEDPNSASQVMIIDKNGIGFGDSVNGPFVYGWTIDGTFHTDRVIADSSITTQMLDMTGFSDVAVTGEFEDLKNTPEFMTEQDVASYVDTALGDFQDQLDGEVDQWFLHGKPTLSNAPANQWTTTALKNDHIGDLYFDLDTGYSYRFVNDNGYKWLEVSDSVAAEALRKASQAQDTADGKRRVFTGTTSPKPPYDVGDLWTNGTDIKVCKTARASGSYTASDWQNASTYVTSASMQAALNNYVTSAEVSVTTKTVGGITYQQVTVGSKSFDVVNKSDCILLGNSYGTSSSNHSTSFIQISKQGLLTAHNAVIYGTIYASLGKIGGWEIGTNVLRGYSSSPKIELYAGTSASTTKVAAINEKGLFGMNFDSGIVKSGTTTSGGTKNVTVSFNHAFASKPIVTLTKVSKTPAHYSIAARGVTTTGFTLVVKNKGLDGSSIKNYTTGRTVAWNAHYYDQAWIDEDESDTDS